MSALHFLCGASLALLFGSVSIFLVAAVMKPIMEWTLDRDFYHKAWWTFPLYMASSMALFIGGLGLSVLSACVGFVLGSGTT